MKKLLVFAIAILGFSAVSFGQATGTASASARIVTPISITKDIDLSFGNLAVSALNAGTLVLSPAGGRTRTNGVTIPIVTGTVSAASFTVSGQGSYTYAITLPTSCLVSDGSNTMLVDAFTSTPTPTGTLAAGGTQTLLVGATLNVPAGQVAGTYNSANAGGTTFDVVVNYN